MPIAFIFDHVYFAAMITGRDIKRKRKQLGETQAEFAQHFHVDQSTIARWETGSRPIDGLAQIAVQCVLQELAVKRSQAAQ
jgi:DNA-binding transcriptional regulator YiaG